jgi:hypothetical protein
MGTHLDHVLQSLRIRRPEVSGTQMEKAGPIAGVLAPLRARVQSDAYFREGLE